LTPAAWKNDPIDKILYNIGWVLREGDLEENTDWNEIRLTRETDVIERRLGQRHLVSVFVKDTAYEYRMIYKKDIYSPHEKWSRYQSVP